MNATKSTAEVLRQLHDSKCSDPVAWALAVIGERGPGRTNESRRDQLNGVHAAMDYLPDGPLTQPRLVMVRAVVDMLRGAYPDNDDGSGLVDDLVGAVLPADARTDLVVFALDMAQASGVVEDLDMTQRCLLARDLLKLDGSRESIVRVHTVLQDDWSLALYLEDLAERLSKLTGRAFSALGIDARKDGAEAGGAREEALQHATDGQ